MANRINSTVRNLIIIHISTFALFSSIVAADGFLDTKTILQTNTSYDPRLAIAVDGIIIHRHGDTRTRLAQALQSWREKGFMVGRMFFADSDATNAYWTGKWDGKAHPGDVERNQQGEVVKCAGIRPYMLPTNGWINYLSDMARMSMEVGAGAILPEEPLAHVFTGYEESFHKLWRQRYGTPWQGQDSSALARFLTAQLKNELYIKLETRLANVTHTWAREHHKDTGFILPIHAIYSNIAADLVAPLGSSVALDGVDGYIGQIWTGPVNWALGQYNDPDKSFFTSAYALYDYFTQLTAGSNKKLWLLIDPVEDNPHHKWQEFAQWYQHGVVAMLLMKDVDRYEVMPWPDRIFLPGYATGGKTPAPVNYRINILSVVQALQEMPLGGEWYRDTIDPGSLARPSCGIGIAVADTLMWVRKPHPRLQEMYGMLLPAIARGIPVSSFVMERCRDKNYLAKFKVIVVSYRSWKPVSEAMNLALAYWVRHGGVLVVLDSVSNDDKFDDIPSFWWHKSGFRSPLAHLLHCLHADNYACAWSLGQGWVFRQRLSLAKNTSHIDSYLASLEMAWQQATGQPKLVQQNGFCMRRGPYIIAHAERGPLHIRGHLVDIFDPELKISQNITLAKGQSGLYKDIDRILQARDNKPCVLHATHRLTAETTRGEQLQFTVCGPAQTPAVVRLYTGSKTIKTLKARTDSGNPVTVKTKWNGPTALLQFDNVPDGVKITLTFNNDKQTMN